MFGKKKQTPPADPGAAAASLFGESAQVSADLEGLTEERFPLLKDFAPRYSCGYAVSADMGAYSFTFSFPVRAYLREEDLRRSRFGFLGSCLTLRLAALEACDGIYAFSGKPFRPPDSAWTPAGTEKGVRSWTRGRWAEPEGAEVLHSLILWLEDGGFAVMASARYGMLLQDGKAEIAFWEPAFYDAESQIRVLAEGLEQLRLP